MQTSYSPKPHNRVDYYPLQNGCADVFLRRNETIEEDEEGNTVYVAEEVYFRVTKDITKEMIEESFEQYWENKGEIVVKDVSAEYRLLMLEDTVNFLLGL